MTTPTERRYRAVIADDIADLRFLLSHALTASGHFEVVGQASNGAEAIAVATEQQPDVTLLDLGMPEVNGLEALPEIRRAVPGCIVIVLSGFDPADMEAAARERGAAGYIVKGLSPSQLATELLSMLESIEQVPAEGLVETPADATPGELDRAHITLPAALTSSRQARLFLSERLREWQLDQLLDTALLLTSELVTNAIVHAESPVSLTVRRAINRLRVEVADVGGGALRLEEPDLDATGGRGIMLMDALSAAWGTSAYEAGKLVWFELPSPEVEPA